MDVVCLFLPWSVRAQSLAIQKYKWQVKICSLCQKVMNCLFFVPVSNAVS